MARVNVGKADELSAKFEVHAIPTFVLVRKTGGDLEISQTVVSAHVEKLTTLFENAVDIKNNKK
jgi:hypothetical protein